MNRKQQLAAMRRARIEARRRQQIAAVNSAALDRAKERTGSDWKTAQQIQVSPGYLCHIRKGRKTLSPYAGMKLAMLLNEAPYHWVLLALAQGAKSKRARRGYLDFRSVVLEVSIPRQSRGLYW